MVVSANGSVDVKVIAGSVDNGVVERVVIDVIVVVGLSVLVVLFC